MKIIVVGTGSAGQRHVKNVRILNPTAQFVFYRASGQEDAFSTELDAPVESAFDQLSTHNADAMIIATPSALHIEPLLWAIRAGLPVYVEKPVVTTPRDVARVRTVMTESGYDAASIVGCNLRFLPSLCRMQAMVAKGVIGSLRRVCLEAGQWLPDWRPAQDYRESYSADSKRGGGVILDLMHESDIARWLCGNLQVMGAVKVHSAALAIDSEAAAAAVLMGDAMVVTISLDYLCRRPMRRYHLVGDCGALTWDLVTQQLLLTTKSKDEILVCDSEDFDIGATYQCAIAEWFDAMRTNSETRCSLEQGLASTALAIAIKEAAAVRC